MAITKEKKSEVIKNFQLGKNDTGSCEVQIALLTERINYLTEHLRGHVKDKHSRRGLIQMVEMRKRLLAYLLRTNPKQHASILKRLDIRK
ncbi:MAG: 30S ribosomal protein S15 [Candidatus Omnitrophica bacterium]|nr:30S ribosomal protein S15 [Candidatus Omnitrophota bacterium]